MENTKREYTWEEKYDHAFNTYCSQFNHVLYYIGENYGHEALDQYLAAATGKDVLGKAVFSGLKGAAIDPETFLRSYVPHHEVIGGEVEIIKAEPDEIIVDLKKCGSKFMLVEKWGEVAKYYCRHCEVIRLWEQLGWHSEVDKTNAQKLKGQNIGCRRIFKRIK
jgi:hypothetical protein